MIVMHKKAGDLYQLIDDECKAKINGEWVDAVIYQGADKETGKTKNFVREKSDFNIRFTAVRIIEPDLDDLLMIHRISILKEIVKEYPGKTIENNIAQLEARRKEWDNEQIKEGEDKVDMVVITSLTILDPLTAVQLSDNYENVLRIEDEGNSAEE